MHPFRTSRSVHARSVGHASTTLCAIAAGVILAVVALWPLAPVAAALIPPPTLDRVAPAQLTQALLISALIAALIASLATALGWPLAWALASHSRRVPGALWKPLIFLPLFLPQTLAYTGWGVLRSPDTFVGDRIVTAAQAGARWLPVLIDRVLAVGGLALWSAPLGGAIMAIWVATTPPQVLDVARLESPPGPRRHARLVAMHWRAMLVAWLVVMAIMLGSAVPIHLAQLPTHATVVWRLLAESTPRSRDAVWLAATPAVALALVAAFAATVVAIRNRPNAPIGRGRLEGGVGAALWTAAIWSLALVVPLTLLVATVSDWSAVGRFWRFGSEAVVNSVLVASCVACACVALTVVLGACLHGMSALVRTIALIATLLLVVSAMVPGVMIGAATAEAWLGASAVRDSLALVVLAHVARFGALAAIGALALRLATPKPLRDLDRIEDASGLGDWFRTVGAARWGMLVAVGLTSAALSVQEIEASVMIQPPGGGNLARYTLDALHFARLDDLTAALLAQLAVCGACWVVASVAIVGFTRRAGVRITSSPQP